MREVRERGERIVNGKKLDAGNEERKVTERGAREGTIKAVKEANKASS